MFTIRFPRKAPTPQAPPSDRQPTRDDHRDEAAWHLYQAVSPEGGLLWSQLTDRQRAHYRSLIRLAERASDRTAVRAAHEAVAKLLATHEDESLAGIPFEIRMSYRQRALALCLMFERVLTTGTAATDARILDLATQEADARLLRRRPS